ncbi:MAG: phosphoglycerate kinase [Candidatus Omnitrophica bacterium]|jgi:phosphoglycerate kinase|nr:phosphoglycerate kinase [Candidatus Omnitrophota bacterium]
MKQTIQDLDLNGKRVLIRVDFNVPLDANQAITDDTRIRESLPTIKFALEHGASRVILMSHLGRPKGKPTPEFSLKPVAAHLSKLLSRPVVLASDCVGDKVAAEIAAAPKDALILLENLRFHAEEEKNEPNFAKALSLNGDVYVNDAFGTSHRAHASVAGIVAHLPSGAGFLLGKEIKYLGEATKNPAKPFVLILGGAKVSDKIGLIENMIPKVDLIIIGGAMAYTFAKVTGYPIGMSRFEKDKVELAGEILKKAAAKGIKVLLPVDHVAVQEFKEDAAFEIQEGIKDGWDGVDIGPKTTKIFADALKDARTAVWNGPMGVFEMKNFKNGSLGVAQALANNTNCVSIIGGGDTAACVTLFGLAPKMSHISTGGGASLEYLEGKQLPGIDLLPEKK